MFALRFSTWPEIPGNARSDSHAWSARPIYDLLTLVAGIEPASPGFTSVHIAPHLGTLPSLTAAYPHPEAQIGVDGAKLKQARAQVQQAQASLKQLEEQLSYTTIVAPMDGVIQSRDVEIGDAVSSILVLGSTATLVMTESDTSKVYVQGKVDEADIAHVYMCQPARLKWKASAIASYMER